MRNKTKTNQTFFTEQEMCPFSLIIIELQIKIIGRYGLTTVKMTIIKKFQWQQVS